MFIGVSEMEIMRQYIGLKSPIWPEVGQRIVLLNAEKLRATVAGQDGDGSSSGGGGRNQFSTSGLSNCLLVSTVIVAAAAAGF